MIKTFEEFVSAKHSRPVNEAFQSSKLREIIKQHGKPKYNWEKKMLFDLKDDEVLHYLSVNMSTSYVNSIVPGGYIDLYVRETDEETGKARVGKFIRNIKVLAVKTSDGLNVFENSDEQRVPSYVLFAATPEEHQYLVTAAELGITVFPVPTSVTDEKVIAEEETQGGKVDRFTSFDIQTYIEDKSERFEQIIQGGGTVTPEPDNNTGNNGEQNDQTNGG